MAKILLVEDDNNLREIYGARLSAEGHKIVSAKDGEEALAVAVKEKPDLIISDVMMPRISGFDMLDILRNAPETKDTKVIMMTALSQAEDKARAEQLGADLYLVKSQVTLEDVAKAVDDILNSNTAANSVPDTPSMPPPTDPATDDNSAQPDDQQPPPPPVPADPAPEPEPEDEPLEPPAPTPSEANAAETPVPEANADKLAPESSFSATPIEVVLPEEPKASAALGDESKKNDDSNKPSEPTLEEAEQPFVGPNLAEALADEEKAVSDQIKKFEDNAPTAPPPPAEPAAASEVNNTEKPEEAEASTSGQTVEAEKKTIKVEVFDPDPISAPEATDAIDVPKPDNGETPSSSDETKDADTAKEEEPKLGEDPRPVEEEGFDNEKSHKKLIINPTDDFLKGGPDIQDLAAKEAAEEAAKKSVQPGSVVESTSSEGPRDPNQVIAESDHTNDEFSKISL